MERKADLMNIRNFGRKSLNEVRDKLESLGLALRSSGERGEARVIFADEDDEDMLGDEDSEKWIESDEVEKTVETVEQSEE